MPSEGAVTAAPIESATETAQSEVTRALARRPWVTILACLTMSLLFVGASIDANTSSPDALLRWGYRDAFGVWSGAVWALFTSAFLHQALWHVGLNVYGTWLLGRVIEPAIGWLKMLLLIASSAFVSSAVQLAVFGVTGIGASGIVYALFGFGWLARNRFPTFQSVFSTRNAVLFLTVLAACWIVLTHEIANGAHLGGLLFGAIVAEAFVMGRRPRLARAGTVLMLISSVFVSFVCPWSATWWSSMAYRLQTRGQFGLAAEAYQTSLDITPGQSWVLSNLVRARWAAGNREAADSALAILKKVSSADAEAVEKELKEHATEGRAQP